MDNRITRRRLSNFWAYEWIVLIALCVAVIFLWEMIFSFAAVKLTVGQNYKIYYDYYMVFDTNYIQLVDDLSGDGQLGYSNGETFSYEIQEIDVEKLYQENDTLSYRMSINEGDIIFTDDAKHKIIGKEENQNLTKLRVDGYDMYIFENLLADAKAYLSGLLIDGQTEIKAENLDVQKVKSVFDARLQKDNRFRTEKQKELGYNLELERLAKLCKEVVDFEKIVNLPDEYFFIYTKYEQSKEIAVQQGYSEENVNAIEKDIQDQIASGRQNVRYGLRLDKINQIKETTENKVDLSKYIMINPDYSEKDELGNSINDVVAMVFNCKSEQPDLQYESIAVINNIVRTISTVLD